MVTATAALVALLALPIDAGAAIAVRAATSANTGNNNQASLAVARPAGLTAGDVLVATVAVRNSGTISAPSGWAQVGSLSTNAGTTLRQVTFSKVATSADATATSFTFTFGTNGRGAGGIVAYTGVDGAAPVGASAAATGSGTSATAPSVTAPYIRSRLHVGVSWASTGAITPAAGMTERYENASTNGTASNNAAVEAADVTQAAAGATGARTVTSAANASWVSHAVALN